MTSLSVRLSEEEIAYLEAISKNKKLFRYSSRRSPGRALKALIKWCAENKIDISENFEKPANSSKKLLEQLHVTMPHILYLLRMHILMDSGKISNEEITSAKRQAIDYINTVCGEFQLHKYTEIEAIPNSIGMKQLPIETANSGWQDSK
ncbi:hypothetical protein [Legionella septentrionalis]|uniref:hypothetical protein n=1 Tax=Legionella septentrionalis TaxID=2498109 RepID=UPI000F8CDED7|nr:hypothetical protein [Legionella septentrionalis]RUQ96665.1 hypothetical protein ELY11_07550 [Legionella septentrionalis]